MEIEVNQADYDAAARLNGYANWSVFKAAPQHDTEWMELCAHDFARHRQAAIKERDAQIVAWLRVREEDYRMSGQGGYATVLDLAADAIERGEV